MDEKPRFKDFLFKKFSEWEHQQPGKRSTYTSFAEYLSQNSLGLVIRQQYVSGWIKGDFEPSEKYAPALAEFYGDEVYKLLGQKKPNPLLQQINARWDRIPPEKQQRLAELSEQFEIKNDEQRIQKTSKQRKKTPPK